MSTSLKAIALTALSLLIVSAPAGAEEPKMKSKKTTECATITNADGEDGKNNSGPNSGNGGKGGTIKNPCKAKGGTVSANGGKGGNNNKGGNSGNGGQGGTIEF